MGCQCYDYDVFPSKKCGESTPHEMDCTLLKYSVHKQSVTLVIWLKNSIIIQNMVLSSEIDTVGWRVEMSISHMWSVFEILRPVSLHSFTWRICMIEMSCTCHQWENWCNNYHKWCLQLIRLQRLIAYIRLTHGFILLRVSIRWSWCDKYE